MKSRDQGLCGQCTNGLDVGCRPHLPESGCSGRSRNSLLCMHPRLFVDKITKTPDGSLDDRAQNINEDCGIVRSGILTHTRDQLSSLSSLSGIITGRKFQICISLCDSDRGVFSREQRQLWDAGYNLQRQEPTSNTVSIANIVIRSRCMSARISCT